MDKQDLLKIPQVQEEISRHRWFESEKAGRDIGYEKAAEDWIARFSAGWLQYNRPEKPKAQTQSQPQPQPQRQPRTPTPAPKTTTVVKTRRASSYYPDN